MPESQNTEWKSKWKDEYLEWICGYANAQGGKIYIGCDDEGNIVGLPNARKLLEDIPNKIRDAMEAFVSEGAELCICMGDLVDHCDSVQESAQCLDEVMRLIRSYPIPFRLLPGNHDYGVFSAGEFFARTGCPMPPYTTDTASHRLIFLDANFRSDFRRFDVAGVDWKDSNLPPAQLDFLARALEDADRPCVVLIHENLDPDVQPDHIVRNAALARRIIEDSGTYRCAQGTPGRQGGEGTASVCALHTGTQRQTPAGRSSQKRSQSHRR